MTVKETALKNPSGIIGRAYRFAESAHAGQKRLSGEPYFSHLLATAGILSEWGLDEETIAAGLLHDSVEDTKVTPQELKKEFGEEIAFLVDGVTKLGRVKYRGAASQAENLRKMILALSQDLRVIFIKLADRLHNMRTLTYLPKEKQKRIALETDEVYAPLAYRLGMQHVSGDLRDLAFGYLHPKEERRLKEMVGERYEERLAYLERMRPMVEEMLKAQDLAPLHIDLRAKRWSSLYEKLLRYSMDIEYIYDLVAMRIIAGTLPDCYAILGAIHSIWPPLPGRIKDYIAMPKPNGYRSLHTTVIGPEEKNIEFQIRTEEMHKENEYGIAAHWVYKTAGREKGLSPKLIEETRWVAQLRAWQEKFQSAEGDPEQFFQAMKIDFLKDRVFAITPRGDVIDLPAGATPVDFAYHVHSEVGDACAGAKVNGQFVPLNHALQSGDLVEVLTQRDKMPSEDWLGFVRTPFAREHIKSALRKKARARREAWRKSKR